MVRTVLTVDTGESTSHAQGEAIISVILKSNDKEDDYEIVASYDLEVYVHDAVVLENSVTITGNATIFFDAKAMYTAKLLENGLEIADTSTFRLIDINNKTSKLINITATTCEVQGYAIGTVIRFIAKSELTEIEESKSITIRDVL